MHYDPLICKLITHGKDRQEALDSMVEAVRAVPPWSVIRRLCSSRVYRDHHSLTSLCFSRRVCGLTFPGVVFLCSGLLVG